MCNTGPRAGNPAADQIATSPIRPVADCSPTGCPVTRPPFSIGNLGEIAIRCRDYPAMVAFYRDVIGLEFWAEPTRGITFFRLAAGYMGHTQVLALFAHDARQEGLAVPLPETKEPSGLHHLALGIAPSDQEAAAAWLTDCGHPARFDDFAWVGWRGLFTTDPNGNTVELVARVTDPAA
jgi:catechol 2,3-dioxygenase-like lactoylglutathione lyase family enzyme